MCAITPGSLAAGRSSTKRQFTTELETSTKPENCHRATAVKSNLMLAGLTLNFSGFPNEA